VLVATTFPDWKGMVRFSRHPSQSIPESSADRKLRIDGGKITLALPRRSRAYLKSLARTIVTVINRVGSLTFTVDSYPNFREPAR
jgi:hypothetical protein